MAHLDLSREEIEMVVRILHGYLATLEAEISHTDHAEFKRLLKDRRAAVERIVERCSAASAG
jgi:hypothetical protein